MPKGVHMGHVRGSDHPAARAWVPPCSEQALREMYERERLSQMEIAQRLGITLKRVQTAMRRFGIPPRRAIKRDQRGEKNASWAGDQATYAAFHKRVEVARGTPRRCERCGTTEARNYEWANLTGHYEDINDYERMCRSCHRRFDNARAGGDAACR